MKNCECCGSPTSFVSEDPATKGACFTCHSDYIEMETEMARIMREEEAAMYRRWDEEDGVIPDPTDIDEWGKPENFVDSSKYAPAFIIDVSDDSTLPF